MHDIPVVREREAVGGWGIPSTVATKIADILRRDWNGSMPKLAAACKVWSPTQSKWVPVKPSTVYAILAQGTGHSSLELIEKLAIGLGCSKNKVANALGKNTPEKRQDALQQLCDEANISLNELNNRCWKYSYIYQVINSNKRTQNFLAVVEGLKLDVERFEEYYKGTQTL